MSLRRLALLATAHLILAGALAGVIATGAGFAAHAGIHLLAFLPLGLVVVPVLRHPRGPGPGLRLVLAAAFLARIVFVLTPPALSGDIHRVIWEGRVLAAGHDPWTQPPDHPALAALRAELPGVRELVDYEKLPAIYPPLSQLVGLGLTGVSTDTRVLKAALVGFEALLVLGLWLLVRERGWSPLLLTAWLWNPLTLTEIAGSGHLDVLGIGLLVFAVLAAERRKTTAAAVLAALSGLAKLAGFAVLPLLLRRAGVPPSRRFAAGAAALATVALVSAPFLTTAGLLQRASELGFSLIHFVRYWRFNESLFLGIEVFAGDRARLAVGVILALLFVVLLARRTHPSLAASLLAGGAFLISPVAHPWYLLWALAFAMLHPERRALFAAAVTLSATVVLSYEPLWNTPPGEPWVLSPILRLLEYLPPAVAALLAARAIRKPAGTRSGS